MFLDVRQIPRKWYKIELYLHYYYSTLNISETIHAMPRRMVTTTTTTIISNIIL